MRVLLIVVALAAVGCGNKNPLRPSTPRVERPLEPLPANCHTVVDAIHYIGIVVCNPPIA